MKIQNTIRMSQLDEIMFDIIDKKCHIEGIINYIKNIEITDENITKIEQLENLIEIHEETARSLRRKIRLMTGKYYIKKAKIESQINKP